MKTFQIALILVLFLLVACNSGQRPRGANATTPTLIPSPAATVTLPVEIITVSIIEASPTSVYIPARQQLLLVVIDDEGYKNRCCKSVTWHMGYLNLEDKQFIRIQSHLSGSYPESISWKLDGTEFIYTEIYMGDPPRKSIVFSADGKQVFTARYGASWLQGGKYLSAITCEGPHINWAVVHTIYDTDSWTEVCQTCEGSTTGIMTGCQGSCPTSQECPPQEASTKKDQATVTVSQPSRYQVTLENDGARIIDSQTGKRNLYMIPGYHIVLSAWSPDW